MEPAACSHERQRTQKCEMEGHTSKGKENVTNKRNICEQVSLQDVQKKVKIECRQCGKTFGSFAGLRDHERAKNHNVITDKKSVPTAKKTFVGAGVQNQKKDMEKGSTHEDVEASSDQKRKLTDSFGDWEKHTKGIGAKLLLGMGFQPGKGLGKNLQGRTGIVEAYLRKGRGSVGFKSLEKKRTEKSEIEGQTSKKNVAKNKKLNICEQVSLQRAKKKMKAEPWQCGKTFGSLASLSDHERSNGHQDSQAKRKRKSGQINRYQRVCRERKNTFKTGKSESAYGGDLLKCNTCSGSFDTVKERVKHELKCNKSKRK